MQGHGPEVPSSRPFVMPTWVAHAVIIVYSCHADFILCSRWQKHRLLGSVHHSIITPNWHPMRWDLLPFLHKEKSSPPAPSRDVVLQWSRVSPSVEPPTDEHWTLRFKVSGSIGGESQGTEKCVVSNQCVSTRLFIAVTWHWYHL